MKKNNNYLSKKQNLDLNLHHLWLTLQELEFCNYPNDIKIYLSNFINIVEDKTFKPIPHNHDILDQKATLITYYEIPNFKNNN